MLIEKVIIENFRCFKLIEVSIEQLTGIVGENGVGKTSILDAIHFALSPYYLSSRINVSDFNNDTDDDITIRLYFNESFIAKLPDGYYSREVPCKGIALVIKKRQRATSGKAFSDGFTTSHYFIPDDDDPLVTRTEMGWSVPRKMDDSQPFKFSYRHLLVNNVEGSELPRSFLFDKNRENQTKIGFNSTLQKLTEDFNWRFRKNLSEIEEELNNDWQKVYDTVINNIGDSHLKSTIKPLKQKLSSLIGKEFENLELSLIKLKEPFSKSFFSVRKGFNQIDKDSMGSGISMFLAFLFLDIISNLSKEKLVIMIDEPELHLHPQFQRKLFSYLSESENQIIYTSHSVNFVDVGQWRGIKKLDSSFNVFPTNEILNNKLTYKGKESSVYNNLDDLNKYYFDKTIITKEHNEIFFSRICILVEGPIEKHAFDILPNRFNYDFDKASIIKANGKEKLKNLQLICMAFGIPYFTVFDLDGKDFNDPENSALKSFSYEENYFTFDDSFEHVIGTHKSNKKTSESMSAIEELKDLPPQIEKLLESINQFKEAQLGS